MTREEPPAEDAVPTPAPPPPDEAETDVAWHSDSAPATGTFAPLPESVGAYRVLERLGAGGMGEVFLAEDPVLGRRIALKRIRADKVESEELRRRFETEARVTAMLQHPAIIPVYHFEAGREAFYTMRPVGGRTLRAILRELREEGRPALEEWSTERCVRVFLQVANAVAYAHSQGVIHRDLKPANIIVGPFDEVVLLDWGLAKQVGSETRERRVLPVAWDEAVETATGFVGTPAYLAPERFDGHAADERSEVFSLGAILFELLALRHPWREEHAAEGPQRPRAPVFPAQHLGQRIPRPLADAVARALELDPARRHADVRDMTRAVAQALEGRARWRSVASDPGDRAWRLVTGRARMDDDVLSLRSSGAAGTFRFFLEHEMVSSMRLEFEFRLRRGSHHLSVWLNAASMEDPGNGYDLVVVPGRARTVSLLRSGRAVTGSRTPPFDTKRWYRVLATRDGDRVSLAIDGEEVYAYRDFIPLRGGHAGVAGRSDGLLIRNLRAQSRAADARVSCLAIPDTFYRRGLFSEARDEYEAVVASHPGRGEAELARFRAGLCTLSQYARETSADLKTLLLEDAADAFATTDRREWSSLMDLGRAMVAAEQGDSSAKHEALSLALAGHPEDPYRAAVLEWILGRLHTLTVADRISAAELLPLAVEHCVEPWGRSIVADFARRLWSSWEVPSFLTGRGRYRENDPVARAEVRLLCGFWAGRASVVEAALDSLVMAGLAHAYHGPDAVFALLALGRVERARALWERHDAPAADAAAHARRLAHVAVLAAEGDVAAAEELLDEIGVEPTERVANTARLAVAQAYHDRDDVDAALRVLKLRGERDYFAREHRGWFLLLAGKAREAHREIRPLVERRDHASGRNLTNVLYGASLLAKGKAREAGTVFRALPVTQWPRTWTLAAYVATARLAPVYEATCFPWERVALESHCRLLAAVGWREA